MRSWDKYCEDTEKAFNILEIASGNPCTLRAIPDMMHIRNDDTGADSCFYDISSKRRKLFI